MRVEAVSVVDAVAGTLRQRLLSGYYRGGEQLKDTDLATEFEVARPTVRAAVQALVAEGLLERGRGRSAAVRSFTAADAVDLYRVRDPLEAAAVDLVVGRMAAGDADLTGVEAAARALSALPEGVSWHVVADHDVAFHREVFLAAGSPRLLRHFDEVGVELRLLIAQLRPAYDHVADLAREHEVLLEALRSGDPERARTAWAGHVADSARFFTDLIAATHPSTQEQTR